MRARCPPRVGYLCPTGNFTILGADMRLIGLVGLSMLPWAFKMLWASFIENHKPWFFRGLPTGLAWIQFCKVCSLIAMTLLWFFAPETHVLALLLLVTLINFSMPAKMLLWVHWW